MRHLEQRAAQLLIVDDDPVDRRSISMALAREGVSIPVKEAPDGIAALELLRSSEMNSSRPPMILLDLNMPRMDGMTFLEKLRAEPALSSAIVFVLTTSIRPEDKEMAYQHNVAGFISKPTAARDFATLAKLIDVYWQVIDFPESLAMS